MSEKNIIEEDLNQARITYLVRQFIKCVRYDPESSDAVWVLDIAQVLGATLDDIIDDLSVAWFDKIKMKREDYEHD